MTTLLRHTMHQALLLLLVAGLYAPGSRAQDRTLIDFEDLTPREVRMEGLVLDERADVYVEAVGALSRDHDGWFWNGKRRADRPDYWPGNAWILDARTREVVWTLSDARTQGEHDGLRSFKGTVTLPAGVYEVYYASFAGTGYTVYRNDGLNKFADRVKNAVNDLFDRDRNRKDRDDHRYEQYTYQGEFVDNGAYHDFRLLVRGAGRTADAGTLARERDAFRETAFVSMADLGDEAYEQAGFILNQPTDVEVYAVGEARGDESYDYGWIINADTRDKVWAMDYDHSEPAGGSDKNRIVRRTLALPAGRYAVFFATDDSHSADEWNAAPPYDPAFWGLTLRVKRTADRVRIAPFDYELVPEKEAFVTLAGLGDDALASRGFTLNRNADVRIYALGEGRDGTMVDYGWIVDAKTHRRVWEMRYYDTEHAGGAQKNRVFDEVVPLQAGDYVVYFVTDDSHAYGDWNSSPPIGGAHWGITLLPASGRLDRTLIETYDERQEPGVLAQIIHARDHAYERQRFTLDQDARVRIYALGEGDDDDMYDYGWIEEARTGRAVWEMTYRMTDHAGGAHKNRVADQTTLLKAGDYVVFYKTDGSHAFGDWNADPPTDPIHWGITVYRGNPQ